MNEIDIAQKKLEGVCYICDAKLPQHKLTCPEKFGTWNQYGFRRKTPTLGTQLELNLTMPGEGEEKNND